MHPNDVSREGFDEGDWVTLETISGKVSAKVSAQESMKQGHIRCHTAGGILRLGIRLHSPVRLSRGRSFMFRPRRIFRL